MDYVLRPPYEHPIGGNQIERGAYTLDQALLHLFLPDGGSPVRAAVTANYTFSVNAAAVPEPASWAVMVLGFAGLGAVLRRRSAAPMRA